MPNSEMSYVPIRRPPFAVLLSQLQVALFDQVQELFDEVPTSAVHHLALSKTVAKICRTFLKSAGLTRW
jgi:hypothetical protein